MLCLSFVAVAKVSFSIRISVHGSIRIGGGGVLSLLVTRYNKTHLRVSTSEDEQKERSLKEDNRGWCVVCSCKMPMRVKGSWD